MKEKWTCPNCDNQIVVHVKLSEPPTCHNPKAHTSKQYQMTKDQHVETND